MENIKTIPGRMKDFVVRHKTGIAVVATAGICLALNRVVVKEHNEFLDSKGLLDEFYDPERDE